jgi:phosphoglucomutase
MAFTGDQLGIIFASRIFDIYKSKLLSLTPPKPVDKLAMVASTVSSKMLEKMAKVEGFAFKESLTGFKYIGNKALELEREGFCVPFGYEEAIGYMFEEEVRDKDGLAATVSNNC